MSESRAVSALERIRRTKLDTYANNPDRISQDFKLEAADSADYSRRFVFELLQNADDEMPSESEAESDRRVRFELQEDSLLVANTGRPFDVDDLEAITTLTQTTKGSDDAEATIGHKGRGFTSVLDVTDHPSVYSRGDGSLIAAEFNRERTRSAIRERLETVDDVDVEESVENVPLMPLPFPSTPPTEVENLLSDGFTTVFRLPFPDQNREKTKETIESTLLNRITRETVALLPQTDRIEIRTQEQERTWTIEREPWDGEGHVDATRVRTYYAGTIDETTASETLKEFVLFERVREIPDQSFAGIEESILEDIGRLRTSVAFRVTEDSDGSHLRPLYIGEDSTQRPYIHVFLPTEERSPLPVLLNGTFQVSTSRRSLNMPTDPETGDVVGLNGWLFEQVAETIATDVRQFVDETATTKAEFLRTIDFTAVIDDETAANDTVNKCLISALQDAFAGVPFVPRLDQLASGNKITDPDPQPLQDVLVPYTHTDKESLGQLVAMIYGRERVTDTGTGKQGYFPERSLLTPDVASVLAALGAAELKPAELPAVLGEADDTNAVLQHADDGDRLTIDPIVHALAETWQSLTDDAKKDAFTDACQDHDVFPVGDRQTGPIGPYYQHQSKPDDVEFFFPPERSVPSDALSGVRLLPRELYYVDGSRQESANARERVLTGGDLQSVLESIWGIKEFAFQEVAETAIFPLLPGPGSKHVNDEPLRNLTVIEFIQRLSCSSTSGRRAVSPENPLPYEYRNAEPYFDLCLLALPTKDGDWARAHELYFSSEWQEERPESVRVESVLNAADVEAPFLAPPSEFGIDVEDEDRLSEWREFFRWIGVTEHVRITPFFHPQQPHRYKGTEHVSAAEGSVVDSDSPRSPTRIPDAELEEYVSNLHDQAEEAVNEDENERPFIWQINGLEFGDHLIQRAESDPTFGSRLLQHLHAWWDQLSRYSEATLALYNNQRLRGRTNYLFTDEEKAGFGSNLWLWRLQREPWFPTSRGRVPPADAWLLTDRDIERFSIDANETRYPLLPSIVQSELREPLIDRPELRDALSIQQHVSQDTLTPDDVKRFATILRDRLEQLTDGTGGGLKSYLPEIRAAFGHLADELPSLDNQGNITADEWRPSKTGLSEIPVPCELNGEITFSAAADVYYVRSHEAANRYSELNIPLFVLRRDETPRVGEHLGLSDLRGAVDTSPKPDEERVEETAEFCDSWLTPAAPYILCRLKATRSSQEMLQRDADGLAQFITGIRLVGDLEIEYTLDGDEEASMTRPADYFIERDSEGNRSAVYVVSEADDPLTNPPTKTVAKALREYRTLSSWEAVYVLLQAAPDEDAMVSRLRDAGAPASPQEIQERRRAFNSTGEADAEISLHVAEGDPDSSMVTSSDVSSIAEERDQDESGTTVDSSSRRKQAVRDGEKVPDVEQLERIGERRVLERTRSRESIHEDGSDDTGSSTGGNGSSSGSTRSVTANYIDKVDEFGMGVTYYAELERLREDGCGNPEEYVHDIHTRDLYLEARDHDTAGPVLRDLEDEGIISKPYPGFDFIVISREESKPERCIELKSSGTNTRRPSISWNEWKAATDEDLRDTYYLYVAAQLESGKSGNARLIQIPDPFTTLDSREQTKRSQSREVQVKLSEFNPAHGEVVERPIYWDE